uniref:ATP synthase F0 subunit 8 n=1 Tax=Panagrolaimus superbus TaxID=310955 RepID=A0A914XZS7_9BILA
MISWGTFTVLFIISFCTTLIYMMHHQQQSLNDSIEALPLFLIFVLRGFIGFLSSLSVIRKLEKKEGEFENNIDNKNFISLGALKVNHRFEKQNLVNIYPKMFEVSETVSLLHG